MKLKNSKIFWGSIPQTSLIASAFYTASGIKLGGAWVRRKRSVPTLCPGIGLKLGGAWVRRKRCVPTLCPGIGCVLATPLHLYITLQVFYIGMELPIFTFTFISFGMLSLYLFRYIISAFYFLVCVPFCHVNLSYR